MQRHYFRVFADAVVLRIGNISFWKISQAIRVAKCPFKMLATLQVFFRRNCDLRLFLSPTTQNSWVTSLVLDPVIHCCFIRIVLPIFYLYISSWLKPKHYSSICTHLWSPYNYKASHREDKLNVFFLSNCAM